MGCASDGRGRARSLRRALCLSGGTQVATAAGREVRWRIGGAVAVLRASAGTAPGADALSVPAGHSDVAHRRADYAFRCGALSVLFGRPASRWIVATRGSADRWTVDVGVRRIDAVDCHDRDLVPILGVGSEIGC